MFRNSKVYRLVVIVGIALLAVLLVFLLSQIYAMSRNSLIDKTSLNIGQHTKDMDYLLQRSHLELTLIASMIEQTMADTSKTNGDVYNILHSESDKLISLFDENTTGLYAWVRNEYLDGTDWVPPEGYVPTQRPWYTNAIEADGKIVFVDPYLDSLSGKIVMTTAKLLSDKQSVVAFDLFMTPLQTLTDNISGELGAHVLILTDSGCVITSTETSEIGLYAEQTNNALLKELCQDSRWLGETNFDRFLDGQKSVAFVKMSSDGWRTVVLSNVNRIFSSFKNLYFEFFVVLVIVVVATIVVIYSINKRLQRVIVINKKLQSLADVYTCTYEMNLIDDLFFTRKEDERFGAIVKNASGTPIEKLCEARYRLTSGVDGKEPLLPADTIAKLELLDNTKVVTDEIETIFGWMREKLVVVDRKNAQPRNVVWVLEDIDDEKRREETLARDVLYDEMTGLLNRKAYELQLKEYKNAQADEKLVFVAMDVNRLKYTNDKYGHLAGDELLKGASQCINACFGKHGKVYRTGGDEFVVILLADKLLVDDMISRFVEMTQNYDVSTKETLAISLGYASAEENPQLSTMELVKLADDRMYENKSKYYVKLGIERRRLN